MKISHVTTCRIALLWMFLIAFIGLSHRALFAADDQHDNTPELVIRPALIRQYADRLVRMDATGVTEHMAGPNWQGTIELPELTEPTITLIALTDKASWIEFTCPLLSSAVGVQFWGDANDGAARLLVDGIEQWVGAVNGESVIYEQYVEVRGLPIAQHTLRVEVAPQSSGHVTLAAFGCNDVEHAVTTEPHQIFLPLVNGAGNP